MSANNTYSPSDIAPAPPAAVRGASTCDVPGNLITNCGFETGDFTGWVAQDIAVPFVPLQVSGPFSAGFGFFTTAPTEGTVSALNGFDGSGPGTIELGQDVSIPATGATLTFDYRAAWDLVNFAPPDVQDRTFSVNVEPDGGGGALASTVLLTASGGTIETDTGIQNGVLDLSQFSGQDVRLNFVWDIPEDFTGPAQFEMDNVVLSANSDPVSVPFIDGAGMFAFAAVLVVAAWSVLRKF